MIQSLTATKKYPNIKKMTCQFKRQTKNINLENIRTKFKKSLMRWKRSYYSCNKNKSPQKNSKKSKKGHQYNFSDKTMDKDKNIQVTLIS